MTRHVTDGTQNVTAVYLFAHFLQPFHELPASCDAVNRSVAQVRLVVESLRRLPVAGGGPALADAVAAYLLDAYAAMLARLGTSFEEVRRVRGDPAQRAALAERLGITLTSPAPPKGDEVVQLLLSPAPPPGVQPLTEETLACLLGVGIPEDPFAAGPVLDDPDGQLLSWTADGVVCGRDTSRDGSLFVTLNRETAADAVTVRAFADRELSRPVASGVCVPGELTALTPAAGGGARLAIEVDHVAERRHEPVQLVAFPRIVAWQLTHLRDSWRMEDDAAAAGRGPAIDPDVVPASLLADPLSGPAAELWSARAARLEARVAHVDGIHAAGAGRPALEVLSAMVEDSLGVPSAKLAELADRRTHGDDVTADLAALHLTVPALDYLARLHGLVAGQEPLIPAEWAAAADILVRSFKDGLAGAWRTEERDAGITLSPDFLRPGAGDQRSPGSEWRAPPTALRERTDVVRARAEQEAAVQAAHADAIAAVDAAALPALRDALLLATGPAAGDLKSSAAAFEQQRFADARASGTQTTTRIEHAVETLQGIVEAVRGDRFRAAPKLILQAPAFEGEWRWMGSYESWRAARFVYLYPENLLLPSTYEPSSPAFRDLLAALGDGALTRQRALEVAGDYARYFEEICTLQVEASCEANGRTPTQPGRPSDMARRDLLYLFGRAPNRGTLYWSAADPDDPTGYPQRSWGVVPTGEGTVTAVFGATVYELPTGQRYIYVFFRRTVGAVGHLAYVRLNLDTHEYESPQLLELPAPATDFSALVVTHPDTYYQAVPKAWNLSNAPQLLIRLKDPATGAFAGNWYERQMNDSGDAWEIDGFSQITWSATENILTVADQGNQALFVILQGGPDLNYGLLTLLGATRALIGTQRYSLSVRALRDETYRGALVFQNPVAFAWLTNDLYLVTRTLDGEMRVRQIKRRADQPGVVDLTIAGGDLPPMTIAPNAGSVYLDFAGFENWFAFTLDNQPSHPLFGKVIRAGQGAPLTLTDQWSARPPVAGPFDIAAPATSAALQLRRAAIAGAYAAVAATKQPDELGYLKEAFLLVPIAIGLALMQAGDNEQALAWMRLVYDFDAALADRKISYLLKQEESLADVATGAANWLTDALSPHRIADTRRNCYTRFTIAAIARCLGALGDSQFAKDTSEALAHARVAYETMLEVMEAPEVKIAADACAPLLAELARDASGDPMAQAGVERLREAASAIADPARLAAVVEAANAGPQNERLARARAAIGADRVTVTPTVGQVLGEAEATAAAMRDRLARTEAVDRALASVSTRTGAELDRVLPQITGMSLDALQAADTRLGWLRGSDGQAPPRPRRTDSEAPARLPIATTGPPGEALELLAPSAASSHPRRRPDSASLRIRSSAPCPRTPSSASSS